MEAGKKDKTSEESFMEEFEALCEKYALDDIDADKLRKMIDEVIDDYV